MKIKKIHKKDAYYCDREFFVGKNCEIVEHHKQIIKGYFNGELKINGKTRYFFAVKLEK